MSCQKACCVAACLAACLAVCLAGAAAGPRTPTPHAPRWARSEAGDASLRQGGWKVENVPRSWREEEVVESVALVGLQNAQARSRRGTKGLPTQG